MFCFDVNSGVVDSLAAGVYNVDDMSEIEIAGMVAGGFRPTTDETQIARARPAVN